MDRLRFAPLLLLGLAPLAAGCGGYTSEYLPPADGRPRLVWQDNKLVSVSGSPLPGNCTSAADSLAGGGSYRVGGGGVRVSGGYYVPVRTVTVVHIHGARPGVTHVAGPGRPIGGSSGGSSGGGSFGGGGSGGGGDLGKAAVVIAVLAITTLPFIALGLAVGRPEPEKEVAAEIDRYNAHVDLARTEGSPCDELVVAGQVAQ